MMFPTHATSLVPHIAPLTTAQTSTESRAKTLLFVVPSRLPGYRADPDSEKVDDENDGNGEFFQLGSLRCFEVSELTGCCSVMARGRLDATGNAVADEVNSAMKS
jgi:hypothetical protein